MNAMFDLTDRVAVVTGASTGLGRAMATYLARAGAAVVLVARRETMLAEAAKAITLSGGRCAYQCAELGDLHNLANVADAVNRHFGPVQIVINAAGVNLREPAERITCESWDATLKLNLAAPFFFSRAFVPGMTEAGYGRIINIASLQSSRAFENGLAYGASKGGIVQLTRAMAEAWSRHGIMCNAIAPGFFPTELTAPVFADPERAAANAARTAVGRNGELTDLQGITVFFASPACNYITGQVLYVDGGFTAR